MIASMQLTEKTITLRSNIQEGSHARLKRTRNLTEWKSANTKRERVYIVLKPSQAQEPTREKPPKDGARNLRIEEI